MVNNVKLFRAPPTPAEKQIRLIKMILIYVKPIAVVFFIIGKYNTPELYRDFDTYEKKFMLTDRSSLLSRTPKTQATQVLQDHAFQASYYHLEFIDII
jgi:hypothetical protein